MKKGKIVAVALCIIFAVFITAGVSLSEVDLSEAHEAETYFSSNDDIYMYCLNHWKDLGVLPSVAIAKGVTTDADIAEISNKLSSAKNKNMFTEQLVDLGEYDTYYLNIRQSELYNYDYQMFIQIAEAKKAEAQKNIEDAEQLANICRQYDAEVQAYTACLNN